MAFSGKIDVTPALKKLGPIMIQGLEDAIISNGSDDTGALIDSLDWKVKNNTLIITFDKYGQYLNDGTSGQLVERNNHPATNRKMPPIEEISGWAHRKGINPWALAKHIQKWGTHAHPWLGTFDKFIAKYDKLFQKELKPEVAFAIDKLIRETIKQIK